MQQAFRGSAYRRALGVLGTLFLSSAPAMVLANSPQSPAEDFAALDLNRDGALEWKEYRSRVSEIFYFADANSDGRIQGDEVAALGEGVAVREGGISHAEFLDEHRKIFQRLDRNADGKLSLTEATGS
ncbi:MAG: hypothetical protein MUE46_08125 [Xanthomonadales bacterium]|jgi:hypothetical protein|nr:hypothetical protein [Xanthomonadales bacterium]